MRSAYVAIAVVVVLVAGMAVVTGGSATRQSVAAADAPVDPRVDLPPTCGPSVPPGDTFCVKPYNNGDPPPPTIFMTQGQATTESVTIPFGWCSEASPDDAERPCVQPHSFRKAINDVFSGDGIRVRQEGFALNEVAPCFALLSGNDHLTSCTWKVTWDSSDWDPVFVPYGKLIIGHTYVTIKLTAAQEANPPLGCTVTVGTKECIYGHGFSLFMPSDSNSPPTAPPTALFTAAQAAGPRTWFFDGSASFADSGRFIASYAWDFGDGQTSTGVTPTHSYAANGTYPVTLTVTDDDGKQGIAQHSVVASLPVVNSTADTGDQTAGDGDCWTGALVQGGEKQCTLRAAIQETNAHAGADTIEFDIPGDGVPVIQPDAALPAITGTVTVNGGSQAAGRVGVQGPGGDSPTVDGLRVQSAGSTIRNLVVGGWRTALKISGSGGVKVVNNRVGVNTAGAGDLDASWANVTSVEVDGSPSNVIGAVGSGNVLSRGLGAGATGRGVYVHGAGATGNTVAGNLIGTDATGTVNEGSDTGVLVLDATGNTIGPGNVIAGNTTEVAVQSTGSATATAITGNKIGVGQDGVTAPASSRAKVGVTIIGPNTSGTTVSGNTIVGSENNVAAVKATNVQIIDNRIGTNPTGDGLGAPNLLAAANGVVLDGASGVTVSGNTIAEQNQFNVLVLGVPTANAQVTISGSGENAYTDAPFGGTVTGANNTVSNNSIGLLNAPAADAVPARTAAKGVQVTGRADHVTISGNTIGAQSGMGVEIIDGSANSVTGNTIGPRPGGSLTAGSVNGIVVHGSSGTTVSSNTISGHTKVGVGVSGGHKGGESSPAATGTTISDNRIGVTLAGAAALGNDVGVRILESASGTHVNGNTISGSVHEGIFSSGAGAVFDHNRIGVAQGSPTAIPNAVGIAIAAGDADVLFNTIANNAGGGVNVADGVRAKVQSNSMYANDGNGINAPTPPVEPTALAAIPQVVGGNARATVVLSDLTGDAGTTVEVFGNPNCTNAEGRTPLFLGAPKAGATFMVVKLKDVVGQDGYSATVTDATGHTSMFSTCKAAGPEPDADGDTIADVIEGLGPHDGDSNQDGMPDVSQGSVASFPNDASEFVTLAAPAGTKFTEVGTVDDPDPNHPVGWSTPAGIIQFAISVVAGSSTTVDVVVPEGEAGTTYWRYGPPTPSAAASWYEFDFVSPSGTGAQPLANGWRLHLVDGGRGDDDSIANGEIRDPGAPVTGVAGTPEEPTEPTGPTGPAAPSGPNSPGATPEVIPVPAVNLAFTGGHALATQLGLGLVLVVLGVALVLSARRRRRGTLTSQ